MNFWEFLDKQGLILQVTIGASLFLLVWLIIRKDIKSKWFSLKKHDRRRQQQRKGPAARRKQ